jgi:hypothetical protein
LEEGATGNTASGYQALYANTVGYSNTASGAFSLYFNYGHCDTAAGYEALYYNTAGNANTASGYAALYQNTTGLFNTASGVYALESNLGGNNNTASGYQALQSNTTGDNNIADGYQAGSKLTTGSNNIEIGNQGTASDHNTIKIGTQGTQAATFIAGIYNHSLTGSEVVITSTGELGVHASSERFKTAIAPMGSNSAKLGLLRPVICKFKSDAIGVRQYGLIAEDVAKVYPELVIRDENGRIDGVRYDELAPMLLNEVQKQQGAATAQAEQVAAQAAAISALQQQLAVMQAAVAELQAKDELIAHR